MKLPIFHGKFLTTTYQIRDDLHAYINNSNDLNFYLPIFFVFALCIGILVLTKMFEAKLIRCFKKGKTIFPFLNREFFDLRKIYVVNIKTGRPKKMPYVAR